MNAIYLHMPDGTPTKWSMCSECHTVACPGNLDLSEKCCACYDCGEPLPKDERTPYATDKGKALYHRECERKRRMAREAELMDKAELVTDYDGPVYLDHVGRGSYGDGYFADAQELSEHLDFYEGERPLFAFCCTKVPLRRFDSDDLIQMMCEEMDEDAVDRIDPAGLDGALELFYEKNGNVHSWTEDNKRKVAIPPAPKPSR